MKILQLCKKIPYPPKDGESIAILSIADGLQKRGHEVHQLCMSTPKHLLDPSQIPDQSAQQIRFEFVYVNTNLSYLAALGNLFTQDSYNIQRFFNEAFAEKLIQVLQTTDFDVIQLEGVYLATYVPLIRKYSKVKLMMRAHNVEFEIWQRLAEEARLPYKRWYLNLLAKRMRRFETEQLNVYDGIIPISVKDAAYFKAMGAKVPIHTLPASVDASTYKVDHSQIEANSLFFIGSLDWMPNLSGLNWFLDVVWPDVHRDFPEAKLYIAGRNMPSEIKELQLPQVVVVGEVPDAQAFMRSKSIMIVPLFSGSGMRVKIIEAMALGKPIIATSLAAEGIAYKADKEMLIANTKQAFKEKIRWSLQETELLGQLSKNARIFIEENHDNGVLMEALELFYAKFVINNS